MIKKLLPIISVASTGFASAALVVPTGISAFHQGDSLDGNGSTLRVIDGSGMAKGDANDPSTWTVSSNAWADDWQGFNGNNTGNNTWVVFDLGAPTVNLDKMFLWNVQEGITAPGNGQTGRGTGAFTIYSATSPTLAPPAASGASTTYDFASGGWTSHGSETMTGGLGVGDSGQNYDVSGASGAQFIGLHITANLNGNRTGLAEAAFTTSPIPEPGSMALLLLGGLGLLRRRR